MSFSGKFAHLIPESRKYADCLIDVASNVLDAYQSAQDIRTFNHQLLMVQESNNNFNKSHGELNKCTSSSYLKIIPDKTLVKSKSMIFFKQESI
ncbi:Hypothetical protein SRAE_2000470500 [Strongyloides ratti]|uniref:Uncharacterized protein n=1 Tax=Strongyloides ratti TaxID=34506 RepID=A0A090LPE3_STRRB|nr:Hypothetical protein SRAE_2000470500 [Strongyloides ratti]CEF70064.1 Hypothetical protein SRAE_2000470500 [Strongyloides ratti]